MLKKALIVAIFSLYVSMGVAHAVEYTGGCTAMGQCINNKLCTTINNGSGVDVIGPVGASCGAGQLGSVRPPTGTTQYAPYEGGGYAKTGLVNFLSRLVTIFITICGIWTLFNFLTAGWTYIYYMHEPKATQEVKDKLTMTAVGLVILAAAFTIAGVIGAIFFKDATFILSPALKGALDFAAESP